MVIRFAIDAIEGRLAKFVRYDSGHKDREKAKQVKLDERVAFLESFTDKVELDLFEGCETHEDKLERAERMVAFMRLDYREVSTLLDPRW